MFFPLAESTPATEKGVPAPVEQFVDVYLVTGAVEGVTPGAADRGRSTPVRGRGGCARGEERPHSEEGGHHARHPEDPPSPRSDDHLSPLGLRHRIEFTTSTRDAPYVALQS